MNNLSPNYASLLNQILAYHPRVSKHNFDTVVMTYVKKVNPSLYYEVVRDEDFEKDENSRRVYWIDRMLDPISRGKILEIFINGLRFLDPLDGISVTTLSSIDSELARYFKSEYLDNFFRHSYIGEIRKAKSERLQRLRKDQASVCDQRTVKARIKKKITAWEHSKRYKLKRARDFQRLKFIKEFRDLGSIQKLKLILREELDFPLISIPDDALFKADLLLRAKIKKNFSYQETYILKMKFLCKKKRDRGENWSSILKAF